MTATLRRKREAGEVHLAEEEEKMERELSLKETEGGKREEGRETEKGRELGLKVERARKEAEAEAAMVNERRRDKVFGFGDGCRVFDIYPRNEIFCACTNYLI